MAKVRDGEAIKTAVRGAYTSFLTAAEGCGCSCCGDPRQSAAGRREYLGNTLGYRPRELTGLPEGAVAAAFGCGNPAAFSQVRPGQVVLDVGSGAGIDCFVAARRVGSSGRVIGVDMTEAMIERATANAAEAGLANVEFRLGDAESLPVEDASVDWVISNCVINLAPDKRRVFREVARVLRPGGRVAISDIVLSDELDSLPEVLRTDARVIAACIGGAVRESEYLAAMREAGLRDVEVVERHVYSLPQIDSFVAEVRDRVGGGARLEELLAELREVVDGRVWSARVVAAKPAAPLAAEIELGPAVATEIASIEELLDAAGLPAHHVADSLDAFLVARSNGRLVGCIALESFGEDGLLRSLAVAASHRGAGIGRRLAEAATRRARAAGVRRLVILTETVADWATRAGFREVAREALSEALRSSWELRDERCAAATAMALDL